MTQIRDLQRSMLRLWLDWSPVFFRQRFALGVVGIENK